MVKHDPCLSPERYKDQIGFLDTNVFGSSGGEIHQILPYMLPNPWWRHQMEIFSALLAFCAGNSPVTGEFPAQRPVTRTFDVLFDLCLNQQLSKQWRRRWFGTPSRSLWRHFNVLGAYDKLTMASALVTLYYTHEYRQTSLYDFIVTWLEIFESYGLCSLT